MLKEPKTINPLLLLLVLACIAMPQANSNIGRMLRVPPAIVLQIASGSEGEGQYTGLNFGYTFVNGDNEGGMLLLVPRSILKFPDASRGFIAGSGQRRWDIVWRTN